MKKALKRIILSIHLWVGLVTGLVVFVEGVTGAIYVFSIEISDIIHKDKRHISGEIDEANHLPLSELKKVAQDTLNEDTPLFIIYKKNEANSTIAFAFRQMVHEAFLYSDYIQSHKTVYLNPYTAEVVNIENTKWEFFNVIMWLHMTLLLGYGYGGPIVSWAVAGFVLLLISGLVLWWPKNKKTRKKRLWFDWNSGFGLKRKIFDLHAILGFYTISLGLIIAITGLFWGFPSLGKGIKWIANGGETLERPLPVTPTMGTPNEIEPLDNVFQTITNKSPHANSYVIKMPRRPGLPFVARAYLAELAYDREVYYFESNGGQLLRKDELSDLNMGEKVSGINYDIHVGAIGGLPTKILAFITCLIIASMPITGFIIWRNKSYKI